MDEENVFVVDSRTVTFGLGLMVREAVRMRDAGLSAREIAAGLEELSGRVHLLAAVNTLKYLKMAAGSRRPPPWWAACWASPPSSRCKTAWWSLWVRPEGGRTPSSGSPSGSRRRSPSTRSIWWPSATPTPPDALAECQAACAELTDVSAAGLGSIGAVVGTHAGPGAAGIAYFLKK